MKLTYAEGWFRAQKRLTNVIEEEAAKRRYSERKLYTVLITIDDAPFCFVESNMSYIGVGFLDSRLREHIVYVFGEEEPGRLFLQRAVHREYLNNTDTISKATVFYFATDGHACIENHDLLKKATKQGEKQIDVTANWEPYPEFGKYESIIRLER